MGKSKDKIYIEKPQGHHCFACGTENPIGLNLEFYRIDDVILTDIVLDRVYEGWENMAHGGIVSTLLDETMTWTLMVLKRALLVTRNMSIKYIKPVPIGIPLTIKGILADDSDPPKVKAKAEIRNEAGQLLVKGQAEFVMVSYDKLSEVPEGLKKEMLKLFEKFD